MTPERIKALVLSCWYEIGPDHHKGNPEVDTDDLKIEAAIVEAVNETLELAAQIAENWTYEPAMNNRDRKACAAETAAAIRKLKTTR